MSKEVVNKTEYNKLHTKVYYLENSIPDATTFTHKNQNTVDTERISLGERNWWCSQQNARY